jgi:hypothetical protein
MRNEMKRNKAKRSENLAYLFRKLKQKSCKREKNLHVNKKSKKE